MAREQRSATSGGTRNEAAPSIAEPRQQKQRDALFKKLAPHSDVIRSIIETAFEKKGALQFGRMLPSDLESARVGEALHMDGKFKNLKADTIYLTWDEKSAVHMEYQTTTNRGMFVRFVMYAEAFEEYKNEHKVDGFPHCVLIYSGRPSGGWSTENHGKKLRRHVDFVLIVLEAMAADAFDEDKLEGRIIGLSRPGATDARHFQRVMDGIDMLSNASDGLDNQHDRVTMLKTALVLAGVDKPKIRPWILERMTMDKQLREGLGSGPINFL